MLETPTIDGLHDFVLDEVVRKYCFPTCRAVDLGAGSGALAVRLGALGCTVLAADLNAKGYKGDIPFLELDLNEPEFARILGEESFDLVTAVEVIEHLENPIGFLRNVGRLLKAGGVGVLTTPNVDNAPARIKFFLRGVLRMMDNSGDPTHISPIFWDLLRRQYLSRAGVELLEHGVYPMDGYKATRKRYAWILRAFTLVMTGECLQGDSHILVVKRSR